MLERDGLGTSVPEIPRSGWGGYTADITTEEWGLMNNKRMLAAAASAALLITGLTAAPPIVTASGGDGASSPSASVDSGRALVQLVGDPLATAAKSRPAKGNKIDFANSRVRSYRAELAARRNEFKQWLGANAPKARVTGEFDLSLNAIGIELNGTSLDTLRRSPLVLTVEYEGLYHPLADDPDLSIINATQAWQEQGGSAANAGEGVKVAIIDTGIDITHPCFSDSGYPPAPHLGTQEFTNNKVIVAKVFSNKAIAGHYTPEAIQDHGTHVAGTVACNYQTPAKVDGVTIPYGISGVAPRALLGNYNVFPADVVNARSEDIVNALDAAYADGFDVANMSLGGGSHGVQDLLTVAVDNLDRANMVVAVAAGNSGPGPNTIESPGMAARALTAGASTVPHFVGATLTVGSTPYPIASGNFAVVGSDLIQPLGVVAGATNGLGAACTALPAGSLTAKIAVLRRGTCSFTTKIRNAQAGGASAVIVVNNVAGDPTAMAADGTAPAPTIPAYMVGLAAASALVAANAQSATIGSVLGYVQTSSVDIMAGFSSQGPTDVQRRIKPDVVAPGVNVLSSLPHTACTEPPCFAFFSGTSMATPHLAGSAAVVIRQHPGWDAWQVRSAIVNTADQGVLKSYRNGTTVVTDPNIVGAGRENLLSAVNATVLLDPVSISFGTIPSGSGQSRTAVVRIVNNSGSEATVAVSGNATVSAAASIPAGVSMDVTVTATTAKGQRAGFNVATLTVTAGSVEVAHAALFYEVR